MRTVPVLGTKVRSPDGREFSFSSREEFRLAIGRGGITAAWSVRHMTTGRWLPVTEHPVFRAQREEHETVHCLDATEITATRQTKRDHVPLIETLEQDEAGSPKRVRPHRAKLGMPAPLGRHWVALGTRRSLMISGLLLLLGMGVLGLSRYLGRSLERHLSQAQAGNSQLLEAR